MDELLSLLTSEYGIILASIFPTIGGFSAKAAYRVTGVDGMEYFLKIYDKSLPTTRFFVERIDLYMPVLDWLSVYPSLHGRVLTPIRTRNGAFKIETDNDVCVLFLYVNGEVPGINGMTLAQTVELADILAKLHSIGESVPFEESMLSEDISLLFCEQLIHFLDNISEKNNILYDIISPNDKLLRTAVHKALNLRDTIRLDYSPLVLCHGDAHGNNLIQSERLVLADWEDIRIAPAEADLFIHAWHPYGSTLLKAYADARGGYNINYELLDFYILRRRIEDVWVDIQRLTEESPDEDETLKLLEYICRGIKALSEIT